MINNNFMNLNQKESRNLNKDIRSQNEEYINYFNKSFVVFVNEKRTIISEIMTKLHSVKECHIKKAVENMDINDKFTIKKICKRICANLDKNEKSKL